MKLGRNKKCWCGSGLKFKRCHDGRDRKKPISKGEKIARHYDVMKKEKCYVPTELQSECNVIIKAHTISKSSGLSEICDRTNHVLGLKYDPVTIERNKGKLKFEKIGINNASTFKGFCSRHDKELFSSFEDSTFIGTREQCFGLTYRALSKEIHAKEAVLSLIALRKQDDRGMPFEYQFQHQEYLKIYEVGTKKAIEELSVFKQNLDCEMLYREYKPLSYLVIESSKPIPVVVSSIVYPIYSFKGHSIQNLLNIKIDPEQLIFNAFNSNGKGFVLFSWLQDSEIIDNFVDSLITLNKDKIFSALVRFFFSSAENSFISPVWWDSLTIVQRTKIEKLIMVEVGTSNPAPSNTLADDSIHFNGWNIEKIYSA